MEGSGPERVELVPEREQTGLVEPVHAARPDRLLVNETRVLQDAQVLGYGRAGDWQLVCQLHNCVGTLGQEEDDGAAGPIPHHIEHLVGSVSGH